MKFYIIITLTFITSILLAQENTSVALDEYFQAIGGQSNIKRIDNIYSFANCTGPNGKYETEIFSAKGTRTFFRQIRENRPDYIGIVHGEMYWTKGTDVAISNKNLALMWRSHELQWIATHLTERFHDIKFVGIEEFGGESTIKFSAIDEVNKTAYLYFDKASYLLRGFTILNPLTENQESIQMFINVWEKFENILLPSKVTFKDKNGEFILDFNTIKINQDESTIFDIPEKIVATRDLLDLHELQRTAHFNRDAKLLVSILADNYTEISNGKINSPNKEDLVKRLQNYFDAITFIEWDDINPPIIKVSEDATMAYVLVNKSVRLKTKDNKEELMIFAWTSTFEKINGNWLMTTITSTVNN